MRKGIALLLSVFCVCLIAQNANGEVRWKLDYKPIKMDRISIKTGMKWKASWYLIYQVTNKGDATVPLRLNIKAVSDVAGKTYLQGYYQRVEQAIERKEGRNFLNIRDMRGEIGPGETKEAVAIFGSIVESTDKLAVQVMGLWDRISHEGQKVFIEDRMLVLNYYRPGDEYFPQYDKIAFRGADWKVIFREEKK